jgi:hypothetical protein
MLTFLQYWGSITKEDPQFSIDTKNIREVRELLPDDGRPPTIYRHDNGSNTRSLSTTKLCPKHATLDTAGAVTRRQTAGHQCHPVLRVLSRNFPQIRRSMPD